MAEIISSFLLEPMVSAAIEQLTSITIDQIRQHVKEVLGVEDEVEKLSDCLRIIEAVLVDAEQTQMSSADRVRLDLLKDRFYDMEDVLDTWNTARLMKSQIEGGNEQALVSNKKVRCFNPLISCFCIKEVVFRHDIASHIRNINEKLIALNTMEKYGCNLDVNVTTVEKQERKLTTTFDIDESEICGREHEKNELLSQLLCESSEGQQSPYVISIVGLGGMGKTTLAQLGYKNKDVISNFNPRIWVTVSYPFDMVKVAKAIVEGLNHSTSHFSHLESLMQHIFESMVGKKFLIVLDDVWTENYDDLKPFYNCLRTGLQGSKILITTRNNTVARNVKSDHVINIQKLPENNCYLMFDKIIFSGEENEPILKRIGRRIVDKCNGLPLAIKVIANLLNSKKTREEWQDILDNDMWEREDVGKGVLTPLLLSYYDLSSMVKSCFVYCAIFPKTWELDRNQLIHLWMAQGYFKSSQDTNMEIRGRECFNILAARSFFQELKEIKDGRGGNIKCKMHDIIHDLAISLSRNQYLMVEDGELKGGNAQKIRHLMMINNQMSQKTPFPSNSPTLKKLRTFIVEEFYDADFVQVPLPPKYFDQLTSLRALCFYKTEFEKIPEEIKKLIHLRFLEIFYNNCIKELPEVLSELYNLQSLKVENCFELKRLPRGIGKLINLRHLMTWDCRELSYIGEGIEKLTSLRTLTTFFVKGGDDDSEGSIFECLRNLNHLRYLGIRGFGHVTDAADVKKAELQKKNLFFLELDFDHFNEDPDGHVSRHDETLLKAVQPPPHLEILEIWNYRGNTICPNWMMSTITALKQLSLIGCFKFACLPPLGMLPYLEVLSIRSNPIERVSKELLVIESGGASSSSSKVCVFPKLKSLQFGLMFHWKEWDYGIDEDDTTIMPCLRSLVFYNCPHLGKIPEELFHRTTLEELVMSRPSPVLKKRYEEWKRIQAQRLSTSN